MNNIKKSNNTKKNKSFFHLSYGISLFLVLVIATACVLFFLFKRTKPKKQIQNVVLISIDTCRPDYLSCYGYSRKTTPNIDACAKDGIIFENAVTPIPLTLPAHTSMLTGTIPPYHGVRDNGYQVNASNITLAEILKENDFVTAAVIGAFVLDSQFGLDQGFDTYNDRFSKKHKKTAFSYNERKGEEVTHFANTWLQEHKEQKLFLFVHYYDPHYYYEAPEPFGSKYSNTPYAGEIAYVDFCIGEIIKKLKKLDLYDSTLLIITGDHGESLGEHSEHTHGYLIYQSTLRVPLVFKVPGATKGEKINDLVSLVDIVPTVCALLDIPVPSQIQGTSIYAYLYGKKSESDKRNFYCESLTPTKYNFNPLFGLINDSWKYIHSLKPELFNLKNDPQENQNLFSQQTQQARIMKEQLEQILEKSIRKDTAETKTVLNKEARQRLESLGYVSGGGTLDERFRLDPDKGTANDSISLYNSYSKFRQFFITENYDQAREACEELLANWPDTLYNHFLLGSVAIRQGDDETVIKYLSPILESFEKQKTDFYEVKLLEPEYLTAYNNLGLAFFHQGKIDKAIATYKKALSYNNNLPETNYNLGNAYLELGELNDAVACYEKALEIDPALPKAHCNLANALVKLNKFEMAVKHYEKALKTNPDEETILLIYDGIAKVSVKQKNFDRAVNYWSKALKLKPNQFDVLNDMGVIFSHQGKLDKAIENWNRSLNLNYNQAKVHKWLGNALAHNKKIDEMIKHWQQSIKIEPAQPDLHAKLAAVLYQKNRFDDAFTHWSYALNVQPNNTDVLNSLAWMMATHKNKDFYDPKKAVEHARLACKLTEYKQPTILDTLSVTYAAAGKFDDAVKTARKAIAIAASATQQELVKEIEAHLQLFKTGQPYVENETAVK